MPRDLINEEDELLRDFVAPGSPATSTPVVSPVARALLDGRARIERPEHWTQWIIRRENADGSVARCALGAVCDLPAGGDAMDALIDALPPGFTSKVSDGVAAFNNTHTHADVLALFDRAIAAASKA